MSSSHSESEVKKAQPSRLEYSGEDSELHQKIFGSLHHCMRCKYFTRSIFSLQNHIKRHKSGGQEFSCDCSTPEKYFCTECTFSTFLKTYFSRHIRECHRLKKENESKLDLKIQKCQECQFWTYSELVLLKHQSSSECFNRENSNEEKKAIVTCVFEDGVKWYICHHCKRRTKSKIHLRDHILHRHTPNRIKWYKCNECDYKAKKRRELRAHITAHHTSLKHINWYSCNQCEYKSLNASNLKYHMDHHQTCNVGKGKSKRYSTRLITVHQASLKHTKRYSCSQCEFKTKSSHSLKIHVYHRHSSDVNVKLHRCDLCEYKTTQSSNLKEHKFTVHKAEGIEYLLCGFCNFKTLYPARLKTHIRSKHTSCDECDPHTRKSKTSNIHFDSCKRHTVEEKINVKCDHCEYVTSSKYSLKTHVLYRHTADENINWFVCDQCGHKLKTKSNLNQHLAKHSNEKFSCNQCDYKTTWKAEVNRHMFKKHGIKGSS